MASDNFGKWLGGPNYIKAQQWGTGRTNDGAGKKKFGAAGMRKRIRFNPNPTRSSQPSCQINKQSAIDKALYQASRSQ